MTVVFHRLSILIVCLLSFYARAGTKRYIIYPESTYPQENIQLTDKINALAGAQGKVYISTSHSQISFWLADLTETAYKELLGDPMVLDIHVDEVVFQPVTGNELSEKNGTHLFTPTSEVTPSNLSVSEENLVYVTQKSPVAAELRALSQPAASGSIDHYPNYVYRTGGRPTYVYHVELGVNQQHIDLNGRNVEWLYTGLAIERGANTPTEAFTGGGHSTCTASKAVGNLYGASKSATLVVVKMPDYTEGSGGEVLRYVIDDINVKGRQAKSVVSISWASIGAVSMPWASRGAYNTMGPGHGLLRTLKTQIYRLMAMKVVIVCAAGNAAQEPSVHGGSRLTVDTLPAIFVSAFHVIGPYARFFVVGNSDINGLRYPTSQLLPPEWFPQVYAPGVNIKCASSTSSTGYETRTGTSFSAPLVAGVIADLLSTEQFSPDLPFWWKRPGGESVVWNLVDNAHNPPVFASGNATLVNYTSPVFATTGFDNEQLDVSTE